MNAAGTGTRSMPGVAFHRIVVPTDFSKCSEEAWTLAGKLARTFDAELVLAHVVVEAPLFSEGPFTGDSVPRVQAAMRRWAREKLEQWADRARRAGLRPRTVVRTGVAHEEIVALATRERADLLVIGSHGRSRIGRAFLGSVSDRVIRLAPCPVLTVRERS